MAQPCDDFTTITESHFVIAKGLLRFARNDDSLQ